MNLLEGRTGLIFGVANKRSIAWAIAQSLHRAGMKLAFTYQGERLKEGVEALTSGMEGAKLYSCDVTNDAELESVFNEFSSDFGGRLDCLVHSVAYAPKEDLERDFVLTSREGFKVSHDISAYSLVAMSRLAAPLMEANGGSVIALSYYGAEKAVEGYNVMGVAKASLEASVRYLAANLGPKNIRVNAISAGPVNTLAARGIKGFTTMLKHHAERAPMRRNVELEEIGNTGLFLACDWSKGITGEVIHVDCGYNIVGL